MNFGQAMLLSALSLGTLGLGLTSVVEIHGLRVLLALRRDYRGARELDAVELMETPAERLPPLCRVSGTLGPGLQGALVAPASQRDCLAFRTTVKHRYGSGAEGGNTTETLWDKETTAPLRLTDGPGTVWLTSELYRALLEVLWSGRGVWQPTVDEASQAKAERGSLGTWHNVGPVVLEEHLASLVRQRLIGPGRLSDARRGSRYVVTEKIIAPDTEVHVLARPEIGPQGVMLVAPRRRRSFVLAMPAGEVRQALAGAPVPRHVLMIAFYILGAVVTGGAATLLFRAVT